MDGERSDSVLAEVTHWFFEDYLPTWVGVGSGTIHRAPDFILDYWSAPLHISSPTSQDWLLGSDAVTGLAGTHSNGVAGTELFPYGCSGSQGEGLSRRRCGY
ncbi:hypothetical protein [Streptomyces sp. NPDC002573]|uniref:DUF6841 family protein n=1 Tax=Streptomyces sp. NPDC002573 TaxID=3364651 RepID=UPI0036AC0B9D